MRRSKGQIALVVVLAAMNWGCALQMPVLPQGSVSADLRAEALALLERAVVEESQWVKVHAAEGLLWTGHATKVAEAFASELGTTETGYRVGVLRVMAQLPPPPPEVSQGVPEEDDYRQQIIAIFLDPDAKDRLHALESLAKLGYAERTPEVLAAAEPDSGRFQTYALWVLANSGQFEDQAALAKLIGSMDASLRMGAAYALRHRQTLSVEARAAIDVAILVEADSEKALEDVYLHSARFVHSTAEGRRAARRSLLRFLDSDKKHERNEVCLGLAYAGGARDVPILARLLHRDPEMDVRVYAAFALLYLGQREDLAADAARIWRFGK